MDRFLAYKTLAAVAEEASFSAAAKLLGVSKSAASRQIAGLEAEIGAQLLKRSTRTVRLTEAGYAYLERIRAILDDVREADRSVAALHDAPRGLLRINAPMSFGMAHVAPATLAFMAKYPDIEVGLILNDRLIDPYEEGFDVTLRIGALQNSSLLARKLADIEMGFFAATDYCVRHGTPQAPADLASHHILHYGQSTALAEWAIGGEGASHGIRVHPRLCSNSGEVLKAAALAGAGITQLPAFLLREDIAAGRIARLLETYAPQPLELHALYPPTRFLAAKVRLYVDFLAERFRRLRP
jgi:DNA-binding transcriptional LysR family regulator